MDWPEQVGQVPLRWLLEADNPSVRYYALTQLLVYVDPAYRGQGVGRALITRLIDAAREIGCRQVRVHTAPFLVEALGLYRGLRFREVAQEEGSPEMYMMLSLK